MANALESASLVMIPSGYEDGTLGSLKPTDGTGDFTFSRGSDISATRISADGYIEKGYENLLLQSNSFTTSPWSSVRASLTGSQEGYDGTNDAWLLESTSFGQTKIQVSNSASGVNTISFYAKAGTANYAVPYMTSTSARAWFNLSNGTIESSFNNIDTSIESVGNGWYRCSMAFAGSAANTWILACPTNNVLNSEIGDNIHIQDAMINQGLVAYPYIETTTAPVAGGILEDMPRLDYSNGSCPALLLEPQRTNLTLNSEYTSVSNGGITYNDAISPEGVQNAIKITATSTAFPRFYSTTTLGGGNTYIVSFYVKKGVGDGVGLYGYSNVNYNNVVRFNLDTNEVTYLQTAFSDGYIEDAGNGWKRCVAKLTTPSTGNWSGINAVINKANFLQAEIGDEHYFYGMQVEQDATYPTSYIPTYGVSQTRLADVVSNLVGLDSLRNEATIMAEFKVDSTGSRYYFQSTGGGSYVNVNQYTAERLRMIVRFEGVTIANQVISDKVYPNNWYKIALRYSTNKADVFLNGENIISRTGTWTLEPLDNLTWGFIEGNETKQLLVFPTALTDSECIALTTIS